MEPLYFALKITLFNQLKLCYFPVIPLSGGR